MINQGIYKITNTINKKIYIGSSNNLHRRTNEHINDLKGNKHPNKYLQNAWNKYGEDNFEFEIIEYVENQDDLLSKEQYYLDFYKTYDKNIGYNILSVAGSLIGFHHSQETKDNFSNNRMGSGNSFYGKHHSDETISTISEKVRGENHNRAKLTEEDVLTIYKLFAKKELPLKTIAEMYSVKPNTITQIKNGVIWKHLYHLYDNENDKQRNKKLIEEDVLNIYEMLKNGVSYNYIKQKFNISKQTISSIKNGILWKHLYHFYIN